jgi:tryptophanyl-tRNA synthetase
MSIVTDSTPVEEPKSLNNNALALLRLMASPEEIADWEERHRRGGMGYGEVKKRVFELFLEKLGPARKRYKELEAHPEEVERILADGGRRAREVAQQTMREVRKATGLVTVRDM